MDLFPCSHLLLWRRRRMDDRRNYIKTPPLPPPPPPPRRASLSRKKLRGTIMGEPSDRASSRSEFACSLSDPVQSPQEEWRRPVVKVAEYIPKVAGEPKRTLWRRNSPNMRKRGLKAPSIGPLNSGVDSYSSDLVRAPLPEWRPLVKVTEYMPKLYEGNRDGSYKTGEPSEGVSSGPAGASLDPPADVESDSAEEPEPVAEFTASSSSEEEADRCNTRKKRRQSSYSYDMCKYRGHSWPEVKGLKVHKAERIIKKGMPNLWCEVIQENQLMTMCYCPSRVRIIVDSHNNVVRTPDVG